MDIHGDRNGIRGRADQARETGWLAKAVGWFLSACALLLPAQQAMAQVPAGGGIRPTSPTPPR